MKINETDHKLLHTSLILLKKNHTQKSVITLEDSLDYINISRIISEWRSNFKEDFIGNILSINR
jgi:hypothetical protein